MGAKSQPISPPFGHKAGLPPSKKYLLVRQPLLFPGILWKFQNNYGMMVLKIYRSFTSAKNDDYNSSVYYENP